LRIIVRHAFVATVYNQERKELRASNDGRPRQAFSNASWRVSSASWSEPSIL
jgi:hypothetical protein